MTSFAGQTKRRVSADECAAQVMETVPVVMRTIIEHMRRLKPADLSHSQFRVLIFLSRHGGASLSQVAGHQEVTLPTMSKQIDGLVRRQLVSRETAVDDRRRVTLALTEAGKETLETARRETRKRLASVLAALSDEELREVTDALLSLRRAFRPAKEEAGM